MLDIETEIANEITLRLSRCNRSKKWLAHEIGMDYGKVNRILSDTSPQQLSLSTADHMLRLLGSDLRTVIVAPTIKELRYKLLETFDGYSRQGILQGNSFE